MKNEKHKLNEQNDLDKIKRRLDIFYKYLIDKTLVKDFHYGQMEMFDTFYKRKDLKCLKEYDHRYINDVLRNYPIEIRKEIYELFKASGVDDRIKIENPKLNERQKSEIERLKKRFDIFYNYIIHTPYGKTLGSDLKRIIDWHYQNNNLPVLREWFKDFNANYHEDYPQNVVQDLRKLFKEQLGEYYEKEEQKVKKKIEKLIEKGNIRTLSEFAFAKDWEEANYQDDLKLETVNAVRNLLVDYNKRQKEKEEKKK